MAAAAGSRRALRRRRRRDVVHGDVPGRILRVELLVVALIRGGSLVSLDGDVQIRGSRPAVDLLRHRVLLDVGLPDRLLLLLLLLLCRRFVFHGGRYLDVRRGRLHVGWLDGLGGRGDRRDASLLGRNHGCVSRPVGPRRALRDDRLDVGLSLGVVQDPLHHARQVLAHKLRPLAQKLDILQLLKVKLALLLGALHREFERLDLLLKRRNLRVGRRRGGYAARGGGGLLRRRGRGRGRLLLRRGRGLLGGGGGARALGVRSPLFAVVVGIRRSHASRRAVVVVLHPLQELEVVEGPGLDELVDLDVARDLQLVEHALEHLVVGYHLVL